MDYLYRTIRIGQVGLTAIAVLLAGLPSAHCACVWLAARMPHRYLVTPRVAVDHTTSK